MSFFYSVFMSCFTVNPSAMIFCVNFLRVILKWNSFLQKFLAPSTILFLRGTSPSSSCRGMSCSATTSSSSESFQFATRFVRSSLDSRGALSWGVSLLKWEQLVLIINRCVLLSSRQEDYFSLSWPHPFSTPDHSCPLTVEWLSSCGSYLVTSLQGMDQCPATRKLIIPLQHSASCLAHWKSINKAQAMVILISFLWVPVFLLL